MRRATRPVAPLGPAALGAAIGLAAACAPPPANVPATPPPTRVAPAVTTERVPAIVVTPHDDRSAAELYEAGQRAFVEERWDAAATAFDGARRTDPDGPLAVQAAFNAGWALDNAAKHEAALERYEEVFTRHPDDPLAEEAMLRSMRLALHLNRWKHAEGIADRALSEHQRTGDIGRLVAFTAKAFGLLAGTEPELASPFVERGRSIVERLGLARGGTLHRDVAQLYFALGELRRLRSERIVFDPRPDDFAGALERRCQLLLDSQSAYSDAMRAYDAHWSAMAGYRVGELYQRLHRDLLAVPRPDAARHGRRAALFDGAMRLRYAVLLKKGLKMMDHTVALAERTGERSEWVTRAREAQDDIERVMKEEEGLIAALPYSRAELQAALDAMRQKSGPTP